MWYILSFGFNLFNWTIFYTCILLAINIKPVVDSCWSPSGLLKTPQGAQLFKDQLSSKFPLSPTKSSSSFLTSSKALHCIPTSHIFILSHITMSSSLYYITTTLPLFSLHLSSLSWVSLIIWYSHAIILHVYLISIILFCIAHSNVYHRLCLPTLHYITKSSDQVGCVRDLSQHTCTHI